MKEQRRRKNQGKLKIMPKSKEELERLYGRVWSQKELASDFILTAIVGLTITVRRREDDVVGNLDYQNLPRWYFNFRQSPASA